MKNLSIAAKLFLAFGITIGLAVGLGLVTLWGLARIEQSQKQQLQADEVRMKTLKLVVTALEARRSEKDFMLRDEEQYVDKNKKDREEISGLVQDIKKMQAGNEVDEKLDKIATYNAEYGSGFDKYVEYAKKIGDENSGIYGEFRASAHNIEGLVAKLDQKDLLIDLLQLRRHEKDFLLRNEDEKAADYITQFHEAVKEFKSDLAASPVDAAETQQLQAALDKYEAGFSEVVELYAKKAVAADKFRNAVHEINPLCDEIALQSEETAKAVHETTLATKTTVQRIVTGTVLIMVVVSMSLAFVISRGITRPIAQCVEFAQQVARGDLSKQIVLNTRDETKVLGDSLNSMFIYLKSMAGVADDIARGNLTSTVTLASDHDVFGRTFSQMLENLRQMVGRIRTASGSVASAADEISAATDQITKGAQAQASAADETGSTMEEMSVQIQSVAKNAEGLASNVDETTSSIQQMGSTAQGVAKNAEGMATNVSETSSTIEQMVVTIERTAKNVNEAYKLSQLSNQEAKAGGDAVLKTVEGMKTVSETMANISGVIQSLGQRSEAIGSIVEVIEEIADQTNLLALNAAIEAARAGDAGRGFSVVADEVRKLAERSIKATKEISDVIKKVQQETSDAVKTTEEGATNSKQGIQLADQAGVAINRIVDTVNATSKIMQEISGATNEQSAAAKNVITAVEEMNKLTQSVTSAAKEQAAGINQVVKAAESMAGMTEQVKNATGEQKRGGENVVKAVENINDIAKSNLSAVSQLARSAKDLAKQSEGLQELVQEFNLA